MADLITSKHATVSEVAPGIHRVAVYHEPWRCSVNQYLIADDEPALISTGLRAHFETSWSLIARVLDPSTLRHIVVLHFAAHECGALNDFLQRAPGATALASTRTVLASLGDFAARAPRGLADGELIATGAHGLRVLEIPYMHAWDGIALFDETEKLVLSGSVFGQPGRCEPITMSDRSALSAELYRTFFGLPPESYLLRALDRIEALAPVVLAPSHGSALTGVLTSYFRAYRALVGDGRSSRAAEALVAYR